MHTFHKSCITEWLKQSNKCPVCKTEQKNQDEPETEMQRRERLLGIPIAENASSDESLDYMARRDKINLQAILQDKPELRY
jgi:hypothetical protein